MMRRIHGQNSRQLFCGASSLLRTPPSGVGSSSPLVHQHFHFATTACIESSSVALIEGRRRNTATDQRTVERRPSPSLPFSSSAKPSPPQSQQPPSTPPSQATATSSVSSEEVTKFSSLASTWWDSDRNPLIGMNPVRMSFIVSTLRSNGVVASQEQYASCCSGGDGGGAAVATRPLSGLRALDVGCGGGLMSESLARLGAEVTAVDPSVEVANAAREHSRHDALTRTIDYRVGTSVEGLAAEIEGNSCADATDDDDENVDTSSSHRLFDVVCILEVVEHATDPMSLLGSAARLLRPGGVLFVSTLNRTAKSYAAAILGGEFVLRLLPVGTHSWDKFLSPEEVEAMMANVGLEAVDVCGMVVKPPFVDMRWKLDRKDTDVNWIGAYRRKRSK